MRVLVTGACGFVGRHLITELVSRGHTAYGIDLGTAPAGLPVQDFLAVDICDGKAMTAAVQRIAPDACVHLAAVAFVPAGKSAPVKMVEVNVMGTTRLLEAFRCTGSSARILFISTAQVYGSQPRPAPAREQDPLAPDSLYGITKSAADGIARFYARQYGMDILVARPYNHIGPGQDSGYVISSFAHQVRAIRQGAPPLVKVGNLESLRDFTDVRDICRAYALLLEKGVKGEAYNIASGQQVKIGDVLNGLCALAGVHPEIVRDEALYRPDDRCLMLDISLLRKTTGWAPVIPFAQTLADIMEHG